ncbi:hypothetical protein BY996DRAFT_6595843, partial [Phakopsora pachyrhizi]
MASVLDFAKKNLGLDRPENSQSTRKILEEREWNSLASQIKSFSLKVPTSIYNGARPYQGDTQLYQGTHQVDTTTLDSMDQLIKDADSVSCSLQNYSLRLDLTWIIILSLSNLNPLLKRLLSVISPIILVGPYLFIIFASLSDNAPTLKQIISSNLILDCSTRKNLKSLSQWDCQLEDGKYNQMDQYSVRTDQPCPDQSVSHLNLYSSQGLQVQPQTRTHNQSPKLKEHSNYHRQDSTQRESSEDHPPQLLSGSSERHTTGLDQRMQALNRDWERLSTKSSKNHREAISEIPKQSSTSGLSISKFLQFNPGSHSLDQVPIILNLDPRQTIHHHRPPVCDPFAKPGLVLFDKQTYNNANWVPLNKMCEPGFDYLTSLRNIAPIPINSSFQISDTAINHPTRPKAHPTLSQ